MPLCLEVNGATMARTRDPENLVMRASIGAK
jgi:hypothetical protein